MLKINHDGLRTVLNAVVIGSMFYTVRVSSTYLKNHIDGNSQPITNVAKDVWNKDNGEISALMLGYLLGTILSKKEEKKYFRGGQ